MKNYIYHYTTVKTLALMFSNKTLRFNSLANVDDMEEGQVAIFGDMSKYIFVSSWTKDKKENIALWHMYTNNLAGIRIKIDSSKIKLYKDENNRVVNINSNKKIIAFKNKNFLLDIEYVDNPKVDFFDNSGNITNQQIANLGKFKNKIWNFQNEIRFILMGLPFSSIDNNLLNFLSLKNIFDEAILHKVKTNINYIDLKLDDDLWNDAEILLAPNTNLADERIIRSLIKTYYPDKNIKIKRSSLKLRIKSY